MIQYEICGLWTDLRYDINLEAGTRLELEITLRMEVSRQTTSQLHDPSDNPLPR